MADKKNVGTKKTNVFNAIGRFFKELRGECKKITWPPFNAVRKNTGIVLVICLVIGAGIWIVDFLLTKLVSFL